MGEKEIGSDWVESSGFRDGSKGLRKTGRMSSEDEKIFIDVMTSDRKVKASRELGFRVKIKSSKLTSLLKIDLINTPTKGPGWCMVQGLWFPVEGEQCVVGS